MSYNKKSSDRKAAEMRHQPALTLPPPAEEHDVFTLKEFAGIIRGSYSTAYKIYRRGLIEVCKDMGKVLIPRAEVDRFLKRTTTGQIRKSPTAKAHLKEAA